ncbi:type IV conjugative transfer system pilin TraA [Enterobacter sp.]|uniref:type IV conjugative transfer system pilin TraA n=1 Tax=Enterobacter sp. TaxID=42895 RepID=UPI00296F7C9A|nr:type IV conjugative transfer system pilin TraA [Enterobacter sp.]
MANAGNALHTRKGRAVAFLFHKTRAKFNLSNLCKVASAILLVMFASKMAQATGTDLLSTQNTTVNSTFGSGSSLIKWFYIAEIVMALFTYIKVRSPLVFVGLVICIIFTRIGFAIAS